MLPVFSLFFDVSIAVGATAIVHLANNLFKFALVSRHIHFPTLWRFGIPATIFGALGGFLLSKIDHIPILMTYELAGHAFEITVVKVSIGALMIFFAWFDLSPRMHEIQIDRKYLVSGGVLSGFFGGISGHQGAFRATFLAKSGLTKEQFIGTSNAVSLGVDIARLVVYFFAASLVLTSENKFQSALTEGRSLLLVAIVFAFLGTFLGAKLVKKTTIKRIQQAVGVMLVILGVLMGVGVI